MTDLAILARNACAVVALACLAPSFDAPLRAQGAPSRERTDELVREGYRPAESRAQLLDCHFRALTRRIALDSAQTAEARHIIDVFRRLPSPRARSPEWTVRQAVRDSSLLSLLRQAADSSQYRRNVESERAWFQAGNCNGPSVPRN